MNVSRPQILEYGRQIRSLDSDPLRQRVSLLAPQDRAVAELVIFGGASHRQIARLIGCNAGQVSRLVRRIGRRLHDPRVIALLRPECPLEPDLRQIGVERFLQGKSVAELAREHELSPADVRRRLDVINFWCRGLSTARRNRAGDSTMTWTTT